MAIRLNFNLRLCLRLRLRCHERCLLSLCPNTFTFNLAEEDVVEGKPSEAKLSQDVNYIQFMCKQVSAFFVELIFLASLDTVLRKCVVQALFDGALLRGFWHWGILHRFVESLNQHVGAEIVVKQGIDAPANCHQNLRKSTSIAQYFEKG